MPSRRVPSSAQFSHTMTLHALPHQSTPAVYAVDDDMPGEPEADAPFSAYRLGSTPVPMASRPVVSSSRPPHAHGEVNEYHDQRRRHERELERGGQAAESSKRADDRPYEVQGVGEERDQHGYPFAFTHAHARGTSEASSYAPTNTTSSSLWSHTGRRFPLRRNNDSTSTLSTLSSIPSILISDGAGGEVYPLSRFDKGKFRFKGKGKVKAKETGNELRRTETYEHGPSGKTRERTKKWAQMFSAYGAIGEESEEVMAGEWRTKRVGFWLDVWQWRVDATATRDARVRALRHRLRVGPVPFDLFSCSICRLDTLPSSSLACVAPVSLRARTLISETQYRARSDWRRVAGCLVGLLLAGRPKAATTLCSCGSRSSWALLNEWERWEVTAATSPKAIKRVSTCYPPLLIVSALIRERLV